jgi:hypothetical protein
MRFFPSGCSGTRRFTPTNGGGERLPARETQGTPRRGTECCKMAGECGQTAVPFPLSSSSEEEEYAYGHGQEGGSYHTTYPGYPAGVYLDGTVLTWISKEFAPNGIPHGYITVHGAGEPGRQRSRSKCVIVFHQWIPSESRRIGASVRVRICGEEMADSSSTKPRAMAVCRECDWPKMYNRRRGGGGGGGGGGDGGGGGTERRETLYHEWLALREGCREEVRVTLLREQRALRERQRDAATNALPPPPYSTFGLEMMLAPAPMPMPAPAPVVSGGAGRKPSVGSGILPVQGGESPLLGRLCPCGMIFTNPHHLFCTSCGVRPCRLCMAGMEAGHLFCAGCGTAART